MSEISDCSEDVVSVARSRLLDLLYELDDTERNDLELWISSGEYRQDLKTLQTYRKEEAQLNKIAAKLRKEMKLDAVVSTEKITYPMQGGLSDCTAENTLHVDEFLYDDRQLDKLVDKSIISRHYCAKCGSRDIKELIIISHSTGCSYQLYMFKYLLPKDLSNSQVLDVGSRLGAVLYGAYYFTNAAKIVGVEMNKELCALQEKCIKHFNLDTDRIQVINSDIMNEREVIQNSNIIICNVVDFFVDSSKQIDMWRFFKSAIKKDSMFISMRSIPEILSSLGVYQEFEHWLTVAEPMQIENEIFVNTEENEDCSLYFYKVK